MHLKHSPGNFDAKIRLLVFKRTIATGRIPTAAQLARVSRQSVSTVRSALHRLARVHALTLQSGGEEILRAAPFWAVPTAFHVEVGSRSYWGSCIWDALGITCILRRDARILTACGCCDRAMVIEVKDGAWRRTTGMIHFAVPARRWYENIVFT